MDLVAFDNLVFKNKDEFSVFRDILASLNHIKPVLIKREKFNKLSRNYIKEKGEDKYGKYYNLFLPKDLKQWELLGIIKTLNTKFDLENESKLNQIITQTKIIFALIIREKGENGVKIMCKKNSISEEITKYIQSTKIDYTEAKIILKEIQQNNQSITQNDLSNGIDKLIKNLKNEFELIFLRKGVRMLGNYMETITQEEQLKLDEDSDNDDIILHRETYELDKNALLLRDKIGIDEFKTVLEKARKSGNNKLIEELEINTANMLVNCLYDYPYQMTEKNYGYQPSRIIKSKELYCVGYCFLGHAFLKELGIKHKGIIIHPSHSVLELDIGRKKYYFDASYFSEIHEFEYGNKIKRANKKGKYRELVFMNESIKNGEYEDGQKAYGYSIDIETFLLANIYTNKGVEYPLKQIKESCFINKKLLELVPNSFEAYFNVGTRLNIIDELEEAINNLDKAQEINPRDVEIYLLKSQIYRKTSNSQEELRMLNTAQNLSYNNVDVYLAKAKLYKKINQKKLSLIYQYIGLYMNLETEEISKIHFDEKKYITDLLEEENYKGLLKFLRKIEKKFICTTF